MKNIVIIISRVAQWKRAGPITQRSVDRNHALLNFFNFKTVVNNSTECSSKSNVGNIRFSDTIQK